MNDVSDSEELMRVGAADVLEWQLPRTVLEMPLKDRTTGRNIVEGGGFMSSAVPKSTTGVITIPSSLGDYPVTSIGDEAFSDCSGLASVTIPRSVTRIGGAALAAELRKSILQEAFS